MNARFVFIFFFLFCSLSANVFARKPVDKKTPLPKSVVFMAVGENVLKNDEAFNKNLKKLNSEAEFVIAYGLRPSNEPCQDEVYLRRKLLLGELSRPSVVVLTARDWALCANEFGESVSKERLDALREFLFLDNTELANKGIKVFRQSVNTRFSGYPENQRWVKNGVLFATLHLPSNNNNYTRAAGRNNEFEDRMVANKYWLNRIFSYAKSRKLNYVVLFSDADIFAKKPDNEERDGFSEARKQLVGLSDKFSGKVLFVHGGAKGKIVWHGRSGTSGVRAKLSSVGVGKDILEIRIFPDTKKQRVRNIPAE